MKDWQKRLKENGHDYGVRAQIAGTAFQTTWDFLANKIEVANPDLSPEMLDTLDAVEYAGLAALVSFGPLFYRNKMLSHCHPSKEKRDFYKNKALTDPVSRKKAYIASGIGLCLLSTVAFIRGRYSSATAFGTGGILNFVTAFENEKLKTDKADKKPFKKSGYGYLAMNVSNLIFGYTRGNIGVMASSVMSGIGSLMIAEAEPKEEQKSQTPKKAKPFTP